MKVGARNQMAAEVVSVKKGKLMALVNVKLDEGASASSVMTIDSLGDMKLRKGDRVKVIVKAVNVLLMKE